MFKPQWAHEGSTQPPASGRSSFLKDCCVEDGLELLCEAQCPGLWSLCLGYRERQHLQGDKDFLKWCRPAFLFTYELCDLEKAI